LASFGVFSNYAPLLSVVPMWSSVGGAGLAGAGAATGTTMAATVVAQLGVGQLLRHWGLRRVFTAGAVLMGLPTLGYLISPALEWILPISALRGVGFGMVAVAGSALVADLVPKPTRGAALGMYGAAVGAPQVIFLPAGVWAAEHIGFPAVFVAAGIVALLVVPLLLSMSYAGGNGTAPVQPPGGTGNLRRAFTGPVLVMVATSCAVGGLTTFLPLALSTPSDAALALLLLSAGGMAGRWLGGRWSDRRGAGRLLLPGTALSLTAMALTAGAVLAALPPAGAVAFFGLAFGVLQNETIVMMFERAGPGGSGGASIAWNMAYDGGVGLGSFALGFIAQGSWGAEAAFLLPVLVLSVVLPVAWKEARVRRAKVSARRQ
jgi:MFS family permease